jgi:hypothetical protein
MKRCPKIKTCALYPDCCPDASNSGDYKQCALIKK